MELEVRSSDFSVLKFSLDSILNSGFIAQSHFPHLSEKKLELGDKQVPFNLRFVNPCQLQPEGSGLELSAAALSTLVATSPPP